MLSPLSIAVLIPTALVVVALFAVLWRERTSRHDARVAIASGIVLAMWAIAATVLARRGSFQLPAGATVPPVGINLIVVLLALAFCLSVSSTLRRLLRNQANLIRLHVWRLEGLVFLILMWQGRVPALWALPAGLGDVFVGATAPWVARGLEHPGGRRRAIAWTLFGMADLVVAVALGVMTNPGPTQVFHTAPSAVMLTQYPLALVPAFLVPLAFTLHIVSLLQLLRGRQFEDVRGGIGSTRPRM
jgi:hypothetical protein